MNSLGDLKNLIRNEAEKHLVSIDFLKEIEKLLDEYFIKN